MMVQVTSFDGVRVVILYISLERRAAFQKTTSV